MISWLLAAAIAAGPGARVQRPGEPYRLLDVSAYAMDTLEARVAKECKEGTS